MAAVDDIVATFGYFECASITTKIVLSWNGPAKSTWICSHGFLDQSHRLSGASAGVSYRLIELTGAYQQIGLDEQSRELVTVNTHKVFYCYIYKAPFWSGIDSLNFPKSDRYGLTRSTEYYLLLRLHS